MGITLYSSPLRMKRRRAAAIATALKRRRKIRQRTSHIATFIDYMNLSELQDRLEERLHEIQERVYITRQYMRAIRHEYEGSARESIEQYVSTIDAIYSRVATYYIKNIREGFPVFELFLTQIEEEYLELVLEGGFSEAEVYDYIYGREDTGDLPDGPDCSDADCSDADADDADADTAAAAFKNLKV
jgi:hypothetical protein